MCIRDRRDLGEEGVAVTRLALAGERLEKVLFGLAALDAGHADSFRGTCAHSLAREAEEWMPRRGRRARGLRPPAGRRPPRRRSESAGAPSPPQHPLLRLTR